MGRLALGMGDQHEDLQHTASSSQEFQGEEETEGSQGDQEISECKSAQTDPWVLQSIVNVGVAGDPIEHDSTRVKDALGQPQPVELGVGGHHQSDDQGVTDKSQARESVCLGMPHLGEQGVMGQPQVKTLEVIDQSAGQKEVTGLSHAEDQGFIGHYHTVEQGVFDESHIGEQGVRGYSQVTDQGVIHCCHVGQPRVIDCSVGQQKVLCAPHREGVRVETQDFQWTPVQEVTPARTVDSETKQCQPGAGMFTHTQDAQGGTIGSPKTKRQSVFCTVYCVENDFSEGLPPLPPTEQGTMSEGPIKSSQPVNGELTLSPASLELELSPFLINSRGDSLHKVLMSCRVCLEDKPIKPLPCCKKGVCEDCLKRYLSSQVQLGQVEIKCPITECDKHLDESTILYSLPHDDIIKYKYFLELSHMDSSTKPCPQCKHFTIFKRKSHIPTPTKSENKFKIQCPSCQFVWCFKCHSPWHEGVNCREYKKGDKLLRHWANEIEHGQRNAQKCPRCKVHIQRTEGCDHMTCSQCNTNFCYRCGERYRQLRFFGDHTSNLSIFGCKYRYLPERPHVRRLVRGSVCAGKLLIAPLLLVLGIALGAIAVVIGVFGLPVYCLCKKQRKRTRTGMPW